MLKWSALIAPAVYRWCCMLKPLIREKSGFRSHLAAAHNIARDCTKNCHGGSMSAATMHRYALSKNNKSLTEELKALREQVQEQQVLLNDIFNLLKSKNL
ncbi:hypothetical protein LSTR_LSTR010490 [Laodelphax striatellus]|uniref:Uncharacterized protein n=1 Tax=Laodelphax striatellus TaxID=195883 RepID=A0A482X6F9_LAOST|nr:hypothetical protein LSTR_LSTR010490 [Laodelphax striatellus]